MPFENCAYWFGGENRNQKQWGKHQQETNAGCNVIWARCIECTRCIEYGFCSLSCLPDNCTPVFTTLCWGQRKPMYTSSPLKPECLGAPKFYCIRIIADYAFGECRDSFVICSLGIFNIHSSIVEHLLCMQRVPSSILGISR